ncbi:SUKH-4 family immunity protein [Glycomyces sp. NPDC046736]|uniref:SUKH-4 family immunity protein n=1 Tax=Glycomyces sp. NPDC046736 TaxID=3155615 RepID=UPI0033D234BB
MTTRDRYWDLWEGEEGTIAMPVAQWRSQFRAPAAVYPDADFLPDAVSIFYTAETPGDMPLYAQVNLEPDPEDGGPAVPTVLIGSVPDEGDMLFLFDTDKGEVLYLDLREGIPELVNSSLRTFVDFLYELTLFVDADTGLAGRAERARTLHQRLLSIDAAAFAESDSWWSVAFQQLESA